jgi:hypothetical protein
VTEAGIQNPETRSLRRGYGSQGKAAGLLSAARAGATAPSAPAPSLWTEVYVARRNAAAAFLGAQRRQGEHHSELPYWRVPGFTGLFDDAQMMDEARARGWDPEAGNRKPETGRRQ